MGYLMVSYADVCAWSRDYEVIVNRVSIINQTLGCRYDGLLDSPCRLVLKRGTGRYVCYLCDAPYCEFGVWDVESTCRARDCIDKLADGIWYMMRSGRMQFT